jgi:hypothetical protein
LGITNFPQKKLMDGQHHGWEKQNDSERHWITNSIPHDFQGERTPAWRALQSRFPGPIGHSEALCVAEALAQALSELERQGNSSAMVVPLTRVIKRRKRTLQWWFDQNWAVIEPCFRDRLILRFEHGPPA